VIQLVCHHYNPYPKTKDQIALTAKDPRRTDFGPYQFITDKVLNTIKLNNPELRLFGIHHVALAWMARDAEWTSEKGSQNNNLSGKSIPLLARATPSVSADASLGGNAQMANQSLMGGGNAMAAGMGMMGRMEGAMRGERGDMVGRMGMAGAMGMGMGQMGVFGAGNKAADAEAKRKRKILTRTDFLLQFVWQPAKAEDQPKTKDELEVKLKAEAEKLKDAEKNFAAESTTKAEEAIEAASLQKSQAVDSAIKKAVSGANAGGVTAPPGAPTEPGPPGLGNPPPGAAPATPGAAKGNQPRSE
jgi:type IV pilus assembly protein PilM